MPKVRTTLTIDADVLKAVNVRAARLGQGDSEVLVSGDAHLLDLSARIPVRSPRDFLELLTQRR